MVDELGHVIDGDQLMAVVAESWREQGKLAKPGVVATVMSNLGLERHLPALGLKLESRSEKIGFMNKALHASGA